MSWRSPVSSLLSSGRRVRGERNLHAPSAHAGGGRLRQYEIERFGRSSEILTLAELDNQRVPFASNMRRLVVDELALRDKRIETIGSRKARPAQRDDDA